MQNLSGHGFRTLAGVWSGSEVGGQCQRMPCAVWLARRLRRLCPLRAAPWPVFSVITKEKLPMRVLFFRDHARRRPGRGGCGAWCARGAAAGAPARRPRQASHTPGLRSVSEQKVTRFLLLSALWHGFLLLSDGDAGRWPSVRQARTGAVAHRYGSIGAVRHTANSGRLTPGRGWARAR